MSGGLRGLVGRLRDVVGPGEARAADADLLRRWTARRDEAAFEVLVWRHGRLVLGVCRRLLRGEQDVEDAFQATFLILARKASTVTGQALGPWLHTVARRAALQVRRASARSATSDPRLFDAAAPFGDPDAIEVRAVLDEEVDRLPAKFRSAFVLCQLEGLTTEEAARQLGSPIGTIHSRLSRARALLRARLARRGLEPLAMTAAQTAEPAARLVGAAVNAATGGPPAAVEALTKGVLRAMFVTKAKSWAVVLMVTAVFATGSAVTGHVTTAARSAKEEPRRAAGEAAAPLVRPAAPDKNADPEPPKRKRSELDLLRERLAKAKARYLQLQKQVQQLNRQGAPVPNDLRDEYTQATIELTSLEERVGWLELQLRQKQQPKAGAPDRR
jgi:RNA polymerase sigma factor (sigma-70 family)